MYQWYGERVFKAQASRYSEHRVQAGEQSSEQNHLSDVRLHRQTGQMESQRSQLLVPVQRVLNTHTHHQFQTHEPSQLTQPLIYLSLLSVSLSHTHQIH